MALTKVSFSMIDSLCINVKDFGFDQGNTAAANKAALEAAIASLTRPSTIYIPQGFYEVAPYINIGTFVIGIKGDGRYQTVLANSAATVADAFFYSPVGVTPEYCSFVDFQISGGNAVAGFQIASGNHMQFENLIITRCGNGIVLNGYSNDIVGCDIFSNTGSGVVLGGTLNDVNVLCNRIYANAGIGILSTPTDTDAGLSIRIKDNAIEANAVAGIISYNTKGLNIKDNYFERNGTTGYVYADPETITIKADIHLLAAATISINKNEARSNKCATVAGNQFTPIGVGTALPNLDGIIFTSMPNNLRVENNQIFDPTKVNALIALYANNVYSTIVTQLVISGNSTNLVGFVGTRSASSEAYNAAHLIETQSSAFRNNYANQNVLAWTASSGSTGAITHTSNVFDGQNSWSISDGDRVWGATIDVSVQQELRGNWVWFGVWVNDQGANTNARLIVDGTANRSTTPSGGTAEWTFQSVVKYVELAATSLTYSVQKVGTGAGLLINNPVLAILGNGFRMFQVVKQEYFASAAPTTGTWSVGDEVINSVPTVGQPKSWICTVAGTPGTWVSTGNL